jgi:hypothetical protein
MMIAERAADTILGRPAPPADAEEFYRRPGAAANGGSAAAATVA